MIAIAHTTFSIAFVAIVVQARLTARYRIADPFAYVAAAQPEIVQRLGRRLRRLAALWRCCRNRRHIRAELMHPKPSTAHCLVLLPPMPPSRDLSRRRFVQRLAAVGLTAPMATQLLALSGVAMAQSKATYKPTKRGGGGLPMGNG